MSRYWETLAGDDIPVRAFVTIEGCDAYLDGDLEARVGDEWVPAEDVLTKRQLGNASDTLRELALSDDPLDPDEYEDRL